MAADKDKKKKITVKEFTMWLQGVEEMQDEGWSPSPTQWVRIRSKIDDIEETVQTVQQPASRVVAPPQPDGGRPVSLGPPKYAPSGLNANPQADLAGKPFLPEQASMPAKTPSIDTSDGTYGSPFV